jgi:hypothetical protein
MKLLEPSTEDEMILAFLRAEIESPDYQDRILQVPGARALVDQADPPSEQENADRRWLLGFSRGYPGSALFLGFPTGITWFRTRLMIGELGTARYMDYPRWVVLSKGTRLVADGAKNVDMEWPPDASDKDPSPTIKAIAARVENGEAFPELIFVGEPEAAPDQLVLIEGHSRATAYVYANANTEIDALVGFSPSIVRWRWY